ncbi:MAG: type IX secretion system sortase PorU [Cyclobacteriaceae bacterium]
MKAVSNTVKALTLILVMLAAQAGFSQSSVLSDGDWYKIGIAETGIYRLNAADLSALGLVTGSIDPRTIKIYGNGAPGLLPQANSEPRTSDLSENAIRVAGESDGSFDSQDYILFYAVGPDEKIWTESGFTYEKNIYSDTAYYFITVGNENGKRIEDKENLSGPAQIVSSFDDHITLEEDVNNLLGSGREWYGDLMNNKQTQRWQGTIEGITSDISITLGAASQSSELNFFSISNDDTFIGNLELQSIPVGPGTTYSIDGREAVETFTIGQTNTIDLAFTFEGNTSNSRGYLDFFILEFKRVLRLYGNQTIFRSIDNIGSLLEYRISTPENVLIWDVTDVLNISNQLFDNSGNLVSFKSQGSSPEEFVIFSGTEFPVPALLGKVNNQNLRGDTNYEGIIISNSLFLEEAEILAQFHREHDGLSVKVVTPGQIYNEFSSGRQDITAIRDYAKHVFDNGGKLKYLLLFGDCSFDYKYRQNDNTNFVPTYESRNSFHPIFSHSSDDYFGFFEDDEGEWTESASGDHTMEIGIGRLPAKTKVEAQVMVDKIIYYSTSANTLGKWKNQIAYLGDDGDGNIHAIDIEELSELIDTTYAQYRIDKLLLDAFNQEVGATKESSPETQRALKTRIKEGTFILNFLGHGNEELWMDEEILTNEIINKLTNRNKMPIFVTATCEFGRYDDPRQESGGEKLLLNSNGGAIALLTTSRPVFASTNFSLNEAFHRNVFRKIDGKNQRLGDIIRITKNEGLAGPVNRNFTLLGDPMMMPAFPQLDIEINELLSERDTVSALEEITFTGQILENGVIDTQFNGKLDIVIFDEKQTFRTKGQESSPYNYSLRSNALFRGESSVTNGGFSFTFVVPKTISYQFKKGKMSLYAWDTDQNKDASGSSTSFVIGGTVDSAQEDEVPPSVSMYLNDRSFQNGSTVGSSSVLFAEVSDENGITTTGNGLIQGISLVLNDEIINLNEFYSSDLDTYKSGMIVYPLQDLAPGDYSALLKIYDTHNNLTRREIRFTVLEGDILSIFNPKVWPNPAIDKTTFSFEHDREEEDLEISLIVYNSHGNLMNKSTYIYENSERLVEFEWAARTNSGQLLNRGIYFYRLIITSRLSGATKEIANKLVIDN